MHIITRKHILDFASKHPETASALDAWYRIVKKTQFSNFAKLRMTFPSIDKVGDLFVFNIGGNKVRLIAAIHFNRQTIFIRHVLTHKEYDLNKWKNS